MKTLRIVAMMSLLLIVGCATPEPEPLPTYTPYPTLESLPTLEPLSTHTPYPTYTPYPTLEPLPTYTPIPTPTEVPQPTDIPEPTDTPVPTVGTRQNPIPLGEWVTLTSGDRVFRGRITQVISDREQVRQRLVNDNMFNNVPSEGYRGWLIYFVCEYVSGPEDKPGGMTSNYFDHLCGDGQFYNEPSVVLNGEFGSSGFPGSVFEGWIYRAGAVSDKPDLLIWKESWLGSSLGDGIYLALQ